jgi:hypothetical protein
MSRARNRPPRLEPRAGDVKPAPPPTPEQLLERAKVAGTAVGPGRTELRRLAERIVAGDRAALGELSPPGAPLSEVWAAIEAVFGATAATPAIDPARTLGAARHAGARVRAVAREGGTIACATASPAHLLPLHLALARVAREHGATLVDLPDVGPIRADGRAGRSLRWIDGVAVLTDGEALYPLRQGDAAREWWFMLHRPALVVADGPFAEIAADAGAELVAFAGLERAALAVVAVHTRRGTVVPLRTDRPSRAYEPVRHALETPDGPVLRRV